jgi:hypothetical protein
LLAIVQEIQPATVRQVFYQASVRRLVEKTEAGYRLVCRLLSAMRRGGMLPFSWIADNTRWQRKPRTVTHDEPPTAGTTWQMLGPCETREALLLEIQSAVL